MQGKDNHTAPCFSRQADDQGLTFDDFRTISIVGKGTFGKVRNILDYNIIY